MRLWILISLITVIGCRKEVIEPVIPGGDRIVLLEEFTGKGCNNCPKGSREIDNLLTLFDSNLVVVSIHAGFFADPAFFDIGKYDLRTEEGEQLYDYLGPNVGYPAGIVNRVKFNGNFQHGPNVWASLINSELAREPEVDFSLTLEWSGNTREAVVDLSGRSKVDLSGDLRVSVMLIESGIVDAQDDSEEGGIVEDYVHKYVLRTMGTRYDGEPFTDNLQTGEEFNLQFNVRLQSGWDETQCEVVVFISNVTSSDDIRVLQSGIVPVID